MVAETAREFEALEAQAQRLMGVFTKAGYEAVAPAIIQPADVFLDVVGESLRARTYVFTDPGGGELCLRPDLTVPTCRLHLERHPDADVKARYCYNGPAFRFQPAGVSAAHPREFRQAGIELFGETRREQAEAEVVGLTLEAVRAAGLERWGLRIGDLGLFQALLDAIDMPDRWRGRLRHQLWRPDAFREELFRLIRDPAAALLDLPADLVATLDPADPASSEAEVGRYLEAHGLELIGARSVSEITQGLLAAAADAAAEPLSPSAAELIETYVNVKAPARAAGARLADLMSEREIDIESALDIYHERLQHLVDAGIDPALIEFSAEFGRNLEYYTGFVFEIVVPELGTGSPVAGGGRYDGLLKAVGAREAVPAVGSAIHTERLLSVVNGGGE
ncbi:MAG: ATP phosphoribosyltransferase regulatory subunit [Hyphomicrobiaceae bacterium]|nr:ATP phosphoribosyltransferase regulatory subunit [Hyphomicrobiaceae bacterium]